jgi:hypothetical protein
MVAKAKDLFDFLIKNPSGFDKNHMETTRQKIWYFRQKAENSVLKNRLM